VKSETDLLPLRVVHERREREYAVLRAITDIPAGVGLAEVISALRGPLAEHLSIAGVAVVLYAGTEDEPHTWLSWGIPEPLVARLASAVAENLQAGRALMLRADQNGLRSFVPVRSNLPVRAQPHYLCVPLLTGGGVLGAAIFHSAEPAVFHENFLPFFEIVGRQLGVAAQRASLFEQVRGERERLQSLSRRIVEVQEEERRHLARELHDEIGQLLTGVKLALEMSGRFSTDTVKGNLSKIGATVDDLLAKVRVISLNLRPTMLDDLGLLPALLWHFENFSGQTGLSVDFKHKGLGRRFRAEVETAGYRVIQEALTNVARHAGVKEAVVLAWIDGASLCLQIEDRGHGFDPAALRTDHASSGIVGMRERAFSLGGKFRLESSPEDGTVVFVVLPLDDRLEED
jgi:signal transduction histidine kinase